MRDWLLMAILVLLGLLFYQNTILNRKLTYIYKGVSDTAFYLRDGNCE